MIKTVARYSKTDFNRNKMMYLSIHRAFKTKGVKNGHKFLKNLGFNPNKASELKSDKTAETTVDKLEMLF